MARKNWIIAVVAAVGLVACGVVGVKSFAKTADPVYPEDIENAMNVPGKGDQAEQQYLGGMSQTPQNANSPSGLKPHGARDAHVSPKTASGAPAQAASASYLGSYRWWRRVIGPLFGWWLLLIPAAAAIAALAWITSLVTRQRSSRGVRPLVVFEPDDNGPVAAPRRDQDERRRRAA